MFNITVVNCDNKKVTYEYESWVYFIDAINRKEITPMLDDTILEIETVDEEMSDWWKNGCGETIGDLYEDCMYELNNWE